MGRIRSSFLAAITIALVALAAQRQAVIGAQAVPDKAVPVAATEGAGVSEPGMSLPAAAGASQVRASRLAEQTSQEKEDRAFQLAKHAETRSEARAMFAELLAHDPSDALAAAMVVELSVSAEERVSAVELLRTATAACPDCIDARLLVIDLLLILGHSDDALRDAVLIERTNLTEAQRRQLSAQLARLGDHAGAKAMLETAIGIRKRNQMRSQMTDFDTAVWGKHDRRLLEHLGARDGQNNDPR